MRSDALELGNSRRRQHHRPVRRIECWQQREPVVDQGLTVGDEKLSAVGHNRTHADKSVEIAARDLEHRESPHPPSFMALICGPAQQLVIQRIVPRGVVGISGVIPGGFR